VAVKGGIDSDRLWAIFALRAHYVRPKSLPLFCEPPSVVHIYSQFNRLYSDFGGCPALQKTAPILLQNSNGTQLV